MALVQNHRLIDVSMWIDDFQFPGDEPVVVTGPFTVLPGDTAEYVHHLSTPTQAGTHVQGPRYFLADGQTVDTFPLSRFEGRVVLVDIDRRGEDTDLAELQARIGDQDVRGAVLLLRSGHMEEVIAAGHLDPRRRPGLSMAAAQWLVASGVGMVAIDSVGVESRRTRNYEVNVTLCRGGVLILEGLVNLAALGPGPLWLEAFPLKVRGVEGTPCRAVVRDYSPTSTHQVVHSN